MAPGRGATQEEWQMNEYAERSTVGGPAPGNWGALTLPQGASVVLRAGTYNFTSIDMEPGSQMTLDKTLGAIRVVVRDNIIFRGNLVDGGGLAGNRDRRVASMGRRGIQQRRLARRGR